MPDKPILPADQPEPNPRRRKPNGEAEPSGFEDVHQGFDIESLRLSQDYGEQAGVEETIVDLPVGKPDAQTFFRVNPDPTYRLETYLYRDKRNRDYYLIDRPMWNHPTLLVHRLPHVLIPFIDQFGTLRLWPLRLVGADGKDNSFWASARRAVKVAEQRWTRLELHPDGTSYRVMVAEDVEALGEPQWPPLDLKALVDLGFQDRCIDTERHPIVLALRGAKRGLQ